MKYIVIVGDGMADLPLADRQNKTVLELAHKPAIDDCAARGKMGLVRTIPDGMDAGSDVGNLAVLGYNPREFINGRAPIEALAMGLELSGRDVAVRANLVTLEGDGAYEDMTMRDYSAGDISTQEAAELIAALNKKLMPEDNSLEFFTGITYRHCMVLRGASYGTACIPPHDIMGKSVSGNLPAGKNGDLFLELMKISYEVLADHPVNKKRVSEGKLPANSIWLWSEGPAFKLPGFYSQYGKEGAVISEVDLVKGLGVAAGLDVIEVAGADASLDTNYEGMADAAVKALKKGKEFVFLHIEAPDEAGHQGDTDGKIEAIHRISERVVARIKRKLEQADLHYKMLILPDHTTPVSTRKHGAEPVPFIIFDSQQNAAEDGEDTQDGENAQHGENADGGEAVVYCEKSAEATGLFYNSGEELMTAFLGGERGGFTDGGSHDNTDNLTTRASEYIPPASAERKPKKPFAGMTKKQAIIAGIAALVLVLTIVLAVFIPIWVRNARYIMVRTPEDLERTDGRRYILRDNITVPRDLTLGAALPIELNGFTLTVEGNFAITSTADGEVIIGNLRGDEWTSRGGGAVVVTGTFNLHTPNIHAVFWNPVHATMNLNATTLTLMNDASVNAAALMPRAALNVRGTVGGDIWGSDDNTRVTLYGTARVEGVVRDVALAEFFVGAAFNSLDGSIGQVVQLEQLPVPAEARVVKEATKYRLVIAEVAHAEGVRIMINDREVANPDWEIDLTHYLGAPGLYTIRITALGGEARPSDTGNWYHRFLDSEEYVSEYVFEMVLDTPDISVNNNGELFIATVDNADVFVIRLYKDGSLLGERTVNQTADGGRTVALAQEFGTNGVLATGSYFVTVQAQSDTIGFLPSAWQAGSFTVSGTVGVPELSIVVPPGTNQLFISGYQVENAWAYEIVITVSVTDAEGGITYSTVSFITSRHEVIFDLPAGFETVTVTVRAIGHGLYGENSATVNWPPFGTP